jgi:hypothetical protein
MPDGPVAQAVTTVILAVGLMYFRWGVPVSSLRHIPVHETLFRRVGRLMTSRLSLGEILAMMSETVCANLRFADRGGLRKRRRARS